MLIKCVIEITQSFETGCFLFLLLDLNPDLNQWTLLQLLMNNQWQVLMMLVSDCKNVQAFCTAVSTGLGLLTRVGNTFFIFAYLFSYANYPVPVLGLTRASPLWVCCQRRAKISCFFPTMLKTVWQLVTHCDNALCWHCRVCWAGTWSKADLKTNLKHPTYLESVSTGKALNAV